MWEVEAFSSIEFAEVKVSVINAVVKIVLAKFNS